MQGFMHGHPIVVLPWDFSLHAIAALEYAMRHFPPADVRVICVLEPPNSYALEAGWGPDAEEDARAKCRDRFFQLATETRESGLQFFVEFGDPAEQIVHFSREQNADLIIMSTHGRTGIKRLFMGSVAQKVTALSDVPIVLLPSGRKEARESPQNGDN